MLAQIPISVGLWRGRCYRTVQADLIRGHLLFWCVSVDSVGDVSHNIIKPPSTCMLLRGKFSGEVSGGGILAWGARKWLWMTGITDSERWRVTWRERERWGKANNATLMWNITQLLNDKHSMLYISYVASLASAGHNTVRFILAIHEKW